MKHYNIQNYIRYKAHLNHPSTIWARENDIDATIKRIPHKEFSEVHKRRVDYNLSTTS